MDWKDCELVEVVPGKVSGAPIIRHTRVPADTIIENYEGGSDVAEIADNFSIPESTVRELLAYAASRQPTHQP